MKTNYQVSFPRRLFLDYHGLRILHGWMSCLGSSPEELDLKLEIQDTLAAIPIPNKTMLVRTLAELELFTFTMNFLLFNFFKRILELRIPFTGWVKGLGRSNELVWNQCSSKQRELSSGFAGIFINPSNRKVWHTVELFEILFFWSKCYLVTWF